MYVKQLDKYNRKYQRPDFVLVQFEKTKDIDFWRGWGVSMSCKCLVIGCLFALRWLFMMSKCVVVTVVAVMTG